MGNPGENADGLHRYRLRWRERCVRDHRHLARQAGRCTTTTATTSAKRGYVEAQARLTRRWSSCSIAHGTTSGRLNASYTLAYSEGNAEGPVNSDTNFADTGRTENFDNPWVNFGGYGYLPNDRRHQFKFRGTYAFNENWQVGATLNAQSGRPINELRRRQSVRRHQLPQLLTSASRTARRAVSVRRVYEHARARGWQTSPWTYDLGASVDLPAVIRVDRPQGQARGLQPAQPAARHRGRRRARIRYRRDQSAVSATAPATRRRATHS